jgi:hypothetical protein
MIGRRVSAPPESLYPALGLIALGFVLSTLALSVGGSGAPVFVVFASPGLALLHSRRPRFLMRLTPTALEIAHPPLTVPYDSIMAVVPHEGGRSTLKGPGFLIEVIHHGGHLQIPATVNVPSEGLYNFLRSVAPESVRNHCLVPSALAAFRDDQVKQFGAERVWCCSGRDPVQGGSARRRALGGSALFAGLFWLATDGWIVLGLAGIMAGLALFVLEARGQRSPWESAKTGLVIGPLGLALQQGELSGQLAWQQILGVTLHERTPTGELRLSAAGRGIMLKVEGATLVIADVYDRRLVEIHQQIVRNWH